MRPLRIYMADLSHDTIILVSDTIPINIGYVGSYAKKVHGDDIDISLFKYPNTLINAIKSNPPDLLAMSDYSWNSHLSERFARLAKDVNPAVITVQGGTNFPHNAPEQVDFLVRRTHTDFHVELVDLLNRKEGSDIGVAFFIALYSALQKKPALPGLVVLGDMSIHGNPKPVSSLGEPLQLAKDNGGKRALIPIENKRHFLDVDAEIMEHVDPIFYSDPIVAARKGLGLA